MPQKATMASPIFSAIAGISPANPRTIAESPPTMRVPLEANEAANDTSPTETEVNPAPIKVSPAPIVTAPTPSSANAPEMARIEGANGPSTAPATPITVNAPAIVIRPFAIDSQLIVPRTTSTGVRTAKAPAATSSAAEPANVPFIRFNPMASSASATPMATRPFAIPSQLILPIDPRALATILSAAPTMTRPAPIPIMFFGISLVAMATSVKAPPMAMRPFAISAPLILPKSAIAEANIFIAAAISINATPVLITCFASPVSLVNAVISSRRAAIDAKPFVISPKDMEPKSLQEEARILIAEARITIPVAVVMVFPLNFAVPRKTSISAKSTPTPTSPFAMSFQSILPKVFTDEESILIAAANRIIPVAALDAFLSNLAVLRNRSISASNTPTPISPSASCSGSSSPIFFMARLRTRSAAPIFIMAEAVLLAALPSMLNLSNTAMDVISSANIAPIAASEPVTLSESMEARTSKLTERTAIDAAIFPRASDFNLVCHASKLPRTPSRIFVTPPPRPLIHSTKLPNVSFISSMGSKNFLRAAITPPAAKAFRKSRMPLKSALLRVLIRPSRAFPSKLPMALATCLIRAPIPPKTWRNLFPETAPSTLSRESTTPSFMPTMASRTCFALEQIPSKRACRRSRPGALIFSFRLPKKTLIDAVASSRPGNPKLAPRAEAKAPTTVMAPFMKSTMVLRPL